MSKVGSTFFAALPKHAFVWCDGDCQPQSAASCAVTSRLPLPAGYETSILQGAGALFKSFNVWYVMAGEPTCQAFLACGRLSHAQQNDGSFMLSTIRRVQYRYHQGARSSRVSQVSALWVW